jgi:uncharacterized protein (DUF488 family)
MNKPVIYTIGHSTHTIDYFLELLEKFSIQCLIDVRSVAASAYNPQFNKEPFSNFLKAKGVLYSHFAKEFGARHKDPELLDEEGKVDFEKVQRTEDFRNGVERLRQGKSKGYNIALMCSEAEPFDCHRFAMVSVALEREGFEVLHILKDKSVKKNSQLETQLLKKYYKRIPQPSLYEPDVTLEKQIAIGYKLRNKDIGFSPYSNETEDKI